ncbi:MAG: metalloregulator ArsR/SmtB family transcription factor [Actinomycetota bacterium]|nr:metalloregulator ArsR/SmtB family transcription factor [Actinomycetota bacterium]MDQ6945637.1 metalloregulator ArsR/SmtB family transcription factor [Actinomycetota bacterium]
MTAQEGEDGLDDARFEVAVGTFKLLADYTRLRILWALLHGEHSVGDLAAHVGAQAPAVSQHLAKLRMSHLVKVRREGNRIFYAAENAHVRRLVEEALFDSGHVVTPLRTTPSRPLHGTGHRRR